MTYEHTQTSRYVFPGFIVFVAVFVVSAAIGSDLTLAAAVGIAVLLVVVGLVVLNFSVLSVAVSGDEVRLHFGRGWPRKTIALANVAAVSTVRNKWWYGFGIRYTPHGWMYNVWGLDAVQLDYTDGASFRIGTDEPDLLVAALRAGIPAR